MRGFPTGAPHGDNGSVEPVLKHRAIARIGLLVAPTVIALVIAGIAMEIRRPTTFDLDLTVTKLSFVSSDQQTKALLGKTAFTKLTLNGIEKGTIAAGRVELLRQRRSAAGTAMSTVLSPLTLPVGISQRTPNGATLMLAAPGNDAHAIGELGELYLPPGGSAELASMEENSTGIWARILDRPTRILLSMIGTSNVDLLGATIDTESISDRGAAFMSLRVDASTSMSIIEMTGTGAGPVVILTPPAGEVSPLLLVADLPVSTLAFQAQGPTGAPVTTLSGEGTIGFAEAPEKAKIEVKPGYYVVLGDLKKFYLRKLNYLTHPNRIHVEAGGVAGSLRSGPAGGIQERALTWFDAIWNQPRSLQLLALAAWLFPTTLAGYKLLKEVQQ